MSNNNFLQVGISLLSGQFTKIAHNEDSITVRYYPDASGIHDTLCETFENKDQMLLALRSVYEQLGHVDKNGMLGTASIPPAPNKPMGTINFSGLGDMVDGSWATTSGDIMVYAMNGKLLPLPVTVSELLAIPVSAIYVLPRLGNRISLGEAIINDMWIAKVFASVYLRHTTPWCDLRDLLVIRDHIVISPFVGAFWEFRDGSKIITKFNNGTYNITLALDAGLMSNTDPTNIIVVDYDGSEQPLIAAAGAGVPIAVLYKLVWDSLAPFVSAPRELSLGETIKIGETSAEPMIADIDLSKITGIVDNQWELDDGSFLTVRYESGEVKPLTLSSAELLSIPVESINLHAGCTYPFDMTVGQAIVMNIPLACLFARVYMDLVKRVIDPMYVVQISPGTSPLFPYDYWELTDGSRVVWNNKRVDESAIALNDYDTITEMQPFNLAFLPGKDASNKGASYTFQEACDNPIDISIIFRLVYASYYFDTRNEHDAQRVTLFNL